MNNMIILRLVVNVCVSHLFVFVTNQNDKINNMEKWQENYGKPYVRVVGFESFLYNLTSHQEFLS